MLQAGRRGRMDGMSGIRPGHDGHDTELVAALVTGGLGVRERLAAEVLVRRCAECRTLREQYAGAWGRIGGEIAPVEPAADLRRRVLARVATRNASVTGRTGLRRSFATFRVRTSVAIALAIILPVASVALSGALAPAPAFASTSTLTVIAGSVESSADGVEWAAASDGMVIAAGTHVRTSSDARAVLTFFDGSLLTLESGTTVAVRELHGGDGVVITLFQTVGRTWSSVHRAATGTRYEIGTPTATAAVRGTGFETIVTTAGATTVATSDGIVAVSAAGSTVLVTETQQTDVQPGSAPTTPVRVPARTSLTLRANVPLLAVDPAGLACGRVPGRDAVRQSPRCLVAADGAITLLDPAAGLYRVVARSDSAVDAAMTAIVTSADGSSVEQTAGVSLAAGDQAVAPLELIATDGVARTMELGGFVVTTVSPAKLGTKAGGPPAARGPENERRPTASSVAAPQATREAGPGTPAPRNTPARPSTAPDRTATPAPTSTPLASATPAPTPTPAPLTTALPIATLVPTSTPAATASLAPVDRTPPSVTVSAPAAIDPLQILRVTITAKISDAQSGVTDAPQASAELAGKTLRLLSSTWSAATGEFTATFETQVLDGLVSYTVVAKDRAGNLGAGTATTRLAIVPIVTATPKPTATPKLTASPAPTPSDVTPPTVQVTAPGSLDLLATTVTITATVSDSGSGVVDKPVAQAVTLTGQSLALIAKTWDASTGTYTATFQLPLLSATITYTVTATDVAGNVGRGTATTLLQ